MNEGIVGQQNVSIIHNGQMMPIQNLTENHSPHTLIQIHPQQHGPESSMIHDINHDLRSSATTATAEVHGDGNVHLHYQIPAISTISQPQSTTSHDSSQIEGQQHEKVQPSFSTVYTLQVK